MRAVTISLERKLGEAEEVDEADKNVLRVRVRTPLGEMVCDEKCLVELTLSRDAMLGLGTELIMAADRSEEFTLFRHLRHSEPVFATRILGVYLPPASCQLIVSEAEHGTLQSLLDAVSGAGAAESQ